MSEETKTPTNEATQKPLNQEVIQTSSSTIVQTIPEGMERKPMTPAPQPILGKFKTQEDLEKAYVELEKKLGAPKTAPKTPDEAIKDPNKPIEPTDGTKTPEENKAFYGDLPTELHKFQDSFVKNGGKLTETDYAELQKMGIGKSLADDHIKMRTELAVLKSSTQEAKVQNDAVSIMAEVGGKEQYDQLMQWAATNLSQDDKVAYNNILNNGDLQSARLATAGLSAKRTLATGQRPNLISGEQNNGEQNALGYESRQQMTTDMRSAKYKNDPAFRANVARRIAATNEGNWNKD